MAFQTYQFRSKKIQQTDSGHEGAVHVNIILLWLVLQHSEPKRPALWGLKLPQVDGAIEMKSAFEAPSHFPSSHTCIQQPGALRTDGETLIGSGMNEMVRGMEITLLGRLGGLATCNYMYMYNMYTITHTYNHIQYIYIIYIYHIIYLDLYT